jgi:Pentapeptide repeats (8 copies)
LAADCSRCFGLCCTALPFAVSADFALDKPAGSPCRHLGSDYRCGIHRQLRPAGFAGCATFDCFGAGQQVSQHTFQGRSWRDDPELAGEMFAAFDVMRHLHELLWHLAEVERHPDWTQRAGKLLADVRRLTGLPPTGLLALDLAEIRAEVGTLLAGFSRQLRQRQPGASRLDWARRDLVGAGLAGRDLRGANLRGTLLLAADLTGADLTDADLLGADLRDARLAGGRLAGSLFLTQPQLNAAVGDRRTTLPDRLVRPERWR